LDSETYVPEMLFSAIKVCMKFVVGPGVVEVVVGPGVVEVIDGCRDLSEGCCC
jgi:hypothetical protein